MPGIFHMLQTSLSPALGVPGWSQVLSQMLSEWLYLWWAGLVSMHVKWGLSCWDSE